MLLPLQRICLLFGFALLAFRMLCFVLVVFWNVTSVALPSTVSTCGMAHEGLMPAFLKICLPLSISSFQFCSVLFFPLASSVGRIWKSLINPLCLHDPLMLPTSLAFGATFWKVSLLPSSSLQIQCSVMLILLFNPLVKMLLILFFLRSPRFFVWIYMQNILIHFCNRISYVNVNFTDSKEFPNALNFVSKVNIFFV